MSEKIDWTQKTIELFIEMEVRTQLSALEDIIFSLQQKVKKLEESAIEVKVEHLTQGCTCYGSTFSCTCRMEDEYACIGQKIMLIHSKTGTVLLSKEIMNKK